MFPFGDHQHQTDVPPVIISFDDHLLDFCILRDWTMINDLDFANLLEIESHLPVFFLPYLAPISVTIFDAFEPTVPL